MRKAGLDKFVEFCESLFTVLLVKQTVSLYYKIIKDDKIKQIYSKKAGKFSKPLLY